MSMKERGQYITLLCLQRERGHMTENEISRAVGKLSEEVRGKFVEDEDGKLYNVRMEREIQKREAHSKRQRENVEKRWNKKKEGDGISDGNTMVLPLGNGNGNGTSSSYIANLSLEQEIDSARTSAALAAYTGKIYALPSSTCIAELLAFERDMGTDCCLRAFDIAIDEQKKSWSYIRAILENKKRQGVKNIADWDKLEEQRKEAEKNDYWAK